MPDVRVHVRTSTNSPVVGAGIDLIPVPSFRLWSSLPTGPTADVALFEPTLLDGAGECRSLTIQEGGELILRDDSRLTLHGNLRNYGVVRGSAGTLENPVVFQWRGVNEAAFVGGANDGSMGSHEVVESDTGWWNVHDGTVDLRGEPVTPAWSRLTVSATAGSRILQLPPGQYVGWRPGVEIGIAPSEPPSVSAAFWQRWEYRVLESFDPATGRLTLTEPLAFNHPLMVYDDGHVLGAQVAQLTRSIQMRGEPTGRPHFVVINHMSPQRLEYVGFEYTGTLGKLGRYTVHFHHCGNGSTGSVVRGVVGKRGGNSFVVPHLSNGILFDDCIGWEYQDGALRRWFRVGTPDAVLLTDSATGMYTWDRPYGPRPEYRQPSYRVTWDRCLGVGFWRPGGGGARLAIFHLAEGGQCVARNCSGAGIQGGGESAVWSWREQDFIIENWTGLEPMTGWDFRDCDGNNGTDHILFTWLNTLGTVHPAVNFRGTNARRHVNSEGAYTQSVQWRGGMLQNSPGGGGCVIDHVNSNSPYPPFLRESMAFSGGGTHPAYETTRHSLSKAEKFILDCTFTRYTVGILFAAFGTQPDVVMVWNPTMDNVSRAFAFGASPVSSSRVRVYAPSLRVTAGVNSDYFELTPGTGHPTWTGCTVRAIAPFPRPSV